jgi:putative SOS response-associated peptidase YedK
MERTAGAETTKQPYVLHLERFRPFAFAGIWTAIESRGIGWIRNFAIVTRPAEASIESIHDRMPAIVRSAEYDTWLDPETPAAGVVTLIKRFGNALRLNVHFRLLALDGINRRVLKAQLMC